MNGKGVLRLLPVSLVSILSAGAGVFFSRAGALSPPGSGVIPAALAFVAVALLGCALLATMAASELRLQRLERRLADREPGDE